VFPQLLWASFAIAAAAYLLLFLMRVNVSLRLVRLGWLAEAALVSRGLALTLWSLASWEWTPLVACVVVAAATFYWHRTWLVRARADEFCERISEACRGLRLECRYQPGGLALVERQQMLLLGITRLHTRLLLVRVPSPPPRSKVALLVQWLAKQYSGPVPPIPIDLSRPS